MTKVFIQFDEGWDRSFIWSEDISLVENVLSSFYGGKTTRYFAGYNDFCTGYNNEDFTSIESLCNSVAESVVLHNDLGDAGKFITLCKSYET